jgi:ketosteroid isomerase-like protein
LTVKRCPTCHQTFTESHLSFCIDDGTPLVPVDSDAASDSAEVVRPSDANASRQYGAAAERDAPAYQPPPSYVPPDYGGQQNKRRVWPWVLGCSVVLLMTFVALAITAKLLYPTLRTETANTTDNYNANPNRPENSNSSLNDSNSNSSNWNENLNTNSAADDTMRAPTDEAEVLATLTQLEREWTVANIKADKKTLNRILADDYVGMLPSGKLQGKAEYLRTATPDQAIQKWYFENLKVSLRGDRASLTGVLQVEATDEQGQTQSAAFRFTDKFVWRDGRWQATASEVAPVKQEGTAA